MLMQYSNKSKLSQKIHGEQSWQNFKWRQFLSMTFFFFQQVKKISYHFRFHMKSRTQGLSRAITWCPWRFLLWGFKHLQLLQMEIRLLLLWLKDGEKFSGINSHDTLITHYLNKSDPILLSPLYANTLMTVDVFNDGADAFITCS